MKNFYLATVLLTGLALAPAQASPLSIVFDSPTLSGNPGDVVAFLGTITNTSGDTVFLNSDNFTLAGFDPSVIDDNFASTPVSLDPGANSGDILLFSIDIPAVFPDGNYGGTYTISGGLDGDAQDTVGEAAFTVQVPVPQPPGVPEPSSWLMLLLPAGCLAFAKLRRSATRSS